ncbi:MAG: tRNA uridine-5-carboxymethylaminomethyl(34) synthesis GTPase MnmE, partial [Rhodothermales bacterium]
DATIGLGREEVAFLEEAASSAVLPVLLVGNKCDLPDASGERPDVPGVRGSALLLSAKRGFQDESEIRPLVERLVEAVGEDLGGSDASAVVTNRRHRNHLRRALDAVRAARKALSSGTTGDMLALDLRAALDEIGAITGEITNEDVLDQIFSRFCIGK